MDEVQATGRDVGGRDIEAESQQVAGEIARAAAKIERAGRLGSGPYRVPRRFQGRPEATLLDVVENLPVTGLILARDPVVHRDIARDIAIGLAVHNRAQLFTGSERVSGLARVIARLS